MKPHVVVLCPETRCLPRAYRLFSNRQAGIATCMSAVQQSRHPECRYQRSALPCMGLAVGVCHDGRSHVQTGPEQQKEDAKSLQIEAVLQRG